MEEVEDQECNDLTSDFNDFQVAYGTPAIADFDDNGVMDVAVTTPNGIDLQLM